MRRIRSQLFFIVCALLAAVAPSASQNATDPVSDLMGNWDVPGTTTTIFILPDHFVLHSRWGRGDIKWENAGYYVIAYRERSMACHYLVRLRSSNELSMLRYDNTDPAECDLGEMRRLLPWKQEPTSGPSLPKPNPTTPPVKLLNAPSENYMQKRIEAFIVNEHLPGQYHFADRVDYFDKGLVSKQFAIQESEKYVQKWPFRNYELVPNTLQISRVSDEKYRVSFKYTYRVSDGKKTSDGTGYSQVTLILSGNDFYVVSVKEIVSRD